MRAARGKPDRPWNPAHYRQEAQSPEAQLPQDDRVFFWRETVSHWDGRRVSAPDEAEPRGAPPCAPQMRGCLRLSADCVGGFARRKLAQACERTLACSAMVGQARPDCRPIREFRPRHRAALCDVCGAVRRIAGEAGLVQLGKVSTAGTQLPGHAARHQAMRDGDRKKDVARLREDLAALGTQASRQDAEAEAALGRRRGEEVPAAWARRADRVATIAAAMRRVEARATAAAEAARQRRAEAAAARQRPGPTRRGSAPKAGDETPEDKAPRRCTDAEVPSMQTHNTGGDECANAPASVAGASQIIGACDVTAAANDTQPAVPMAQWTVAHLAQASMERPPDAAGVVQQIPGTSDSGYYSAAAAAAGEQWGCAPSMATGRQRPHVPESEVSGPPTTAKERLAANGRPAPGRAVSARRTALGAPVLGQRKAARGVRRFLWRGLANIRGAWCLVCVPHKLLTLWRYPCAPSVVYAAERVPNGPKMGFFRATSASEPSVLRQMDTLAAGSIRRSPGL
jgi:hypothetical protein